MVPTVDDDAVDDAACVRVCVVGGRLFVQVGGLENCGFALWGGGMGGMDVRFAFTS